MSSMRCCRVDCCAGAPIRMAVPPIWFALTSRSACRRGLQLDLHGRGSTCTTTSGRVTSTPLEDPGTDRVLAQSRGPRRRLARIGAALTSLADRLTCYSPVEPEEPLPTSRSLSIPSPRCVFAHTGQRPALAVPAGAGEPLHHESVPVVELASPGSGRRAASGAWSARRQRALAAAGPRTPDRWNPGLRPGCPGWQPMVETITDHALVRALDDGSRRCR